MKLASLLYETIFVASRRYIRENTQINIPVKGENLHSAIDFGSSCTRSAQRLRTSYVEPKQNMSKSDNNMNNSDINTSSRTHVREEKNREEKNHLQNDVVAAKREPVETGRFKELLRGLTLQSSWGELACMKSGYSTPPRPSPKAIWNEHEAYWHEPTG